MKKILVLASFLLALSAPAYAQHDEHHPDKAPAQSTGASQNPMGSGMMGQGGMNCPMMGPGMMGSSGPHTEGRLAYLKTELKITDTQEKAWKAYADSVRSIDQKRASMAGMMQGMGPGVMGQGMMNGQGMMGDGKMMGGGGNMQQGSALPAPDAIQKRIEMMEQHVKTLKDLQTATKKLYRELDDTQKKTADELLGMPCCMGAM